AQRASLAAGVNGPVIGVAVTVPDYLDRLDVVERTSANELKPVYNVQWGEHLGVTAASAVTENLAAHLPSDDVITLPARGSRSLDFQVNLDLTRFERDASGTSVMTGRWSIADASGNERARARVHLSEKIDGTGYDAMAAAMSRNLAAVSAEIARALSKITTP